MKFLSDDGGDTYNKCHFWSNFEVGSLDWLRSDAYIDFFESLDQDGGFFYERWGDAPVHSIAAGLLLDKSEIKFFNDIAYWHVPFTHCPTGEKTRLDLRCHCNPKDNFDWKGYSCKSSLLLRIELLLTQVRHFSFLRHQRPGEARRLRKPAGLESRSWLTIPCNNVSFLIWVCCAGWLPCSLLH